MTDETFERLSKYYMSWVKETKNKMPLKYCAFDKNAYESERTNNE